MDDALLDLPDDPVELKRAIARQRSLITQRDNAIVQIKREAAGRPAAASFTAKFIHPLGTKIGVWTNALELKIGGQSGLEENAKHAPRKESPRRTVISVDTGITSIAYCNFKSF